MLWKRIARNEIRIKTSKIRRFRKSFFVLSTSFLLVWALYLGPQLFDLILPDIIKSFSSAFIPVLHPVLEYAFMVFFLIFILYPIFMLYRKIDIGIKDIIVSTPAKPGDIFLGEFLGQIPLFLYFVLGIGPLVTSFLVQLNPNLTVLDFFITYLILISLIVFGLLLGNIISTWLEFRMIKKMKQMDAKNLFFVFLPFIVILFFYLFHLLFSLPDSIPGFKNWLSIFPSIWYSNVILYIIEPSLIQGYYIGIWPSTFLIILIPLFCFITSYRMADKFYKLEYYIEKTQIKLKTESKILNLAKFLTPSKYKLLVSTHFKEFFRKLENFNRIIYIFSFNVAFGLFVLTSLNYNLLNVMVYQIFPSVNLKVAYFDLFVLIILSWMGGLTLGIFFGVIVFIPSKGILFIYKKSSRGTKALIFSHLYQMAQVILFIDLLTTIIYSIIFQLNFLEILFFFISYFFISLIILTQALGIQSNNPLFDEKGKSVYFNVYLIVLFQIISFAIPLFILVPFLPFDIDYSIGFILILVCSLFFSSILAILILLFGIRKLNHIE
jgi:hypothetical protein